MSLSLDELDRDYRNFNQSELPYSLSNRLVNPTLLCDKVNGKYAVYLGTTISKHGEAKFVACLSVSHNWILDGDRIKPLPHDAPDIIHKAMSGSDPDDLAFPKLLSIVRDGIEGIDISVNPRMFETANSLSAGMSLTHEIPGLEATLYPYQEHGIAWMKDALESTNGVILADEMGLGKTLQIIALLLIKKPTNEAPALVVCPTTLIANWCREITRFAPLLTLVVHRGADRTGSYRSLMRSQIVITTYDTLVNDISLFRSLEWSFLICDEAQAAKNPESKRRKALEQVPRRYTIPVTGTPMENTLMDLWSLGDLAIPGLLGDKEKFASLYPDTETGAESLSEVIDTIVLKRQVIDVANDLPERTDIDFPIELDDQAKLEYDKIRQETISEYGQAGRLVAVGQLAIYCAHPWLRIKDIGNPEWEDKVELRKDQEHQLVTPKMEICIQILKEAFLTGKKVLIFAVYNHCAELIQNAAEQHKAPSAYWNLINGSTPQEERQNIVDEFTKHVGPAALVLNPKAAGTGLNITAATIVIHYTQNWNPALEMQASARAHRRGQNLPVTVYRLFYQGTVEEAMIDRSQWKRELGNIAVPLSTRDQRDLRKALSISPKLEQ